MNVIAEFVGGPLDGEIRALEEALPTVYVQRQPAVNWLGDPTDVLTMPPQPLVYRREERRPTPSGGFCFRYRLEDA